MSVIAFTKVKLEYGWLGNMSAYPITYLGHEYRTSEALFQAMRFERQSKIQADIRARKSPMGCKMAAKKHRQKLKGPICDLDDIMRMEECIRLKLSQNPQLREKLRATGASEIIEDCTGRPHDIEIDGKNHFNGLPFWGARWDIDTQSWLGNNALGKIWMQFRKRMRPLPVKPFFIARHFNPMNKLQDRKKVLEAEISKVNRLIAIEHKVTSLIKDAGFESIRAFSDELDELEQKKTPVAKSPGEAGDEKIKRTRLKKAQILKIKALRKAGKSLAVVAEKVGCSIGAVRIWEKKPLK